MLNHLALTPEGCAQPIAGSSVWHSIATAHRVTALMRWRTRRAVSGFSCEMEPRSWRTWALVTVGTGRWGDAGEHLPFEAAGQARASLGVAAVGPPLLEDARRSVGERGHGGGRAASRPGDRPRLGASRRLARAWARASLTGTSGKPRRSPRFRPQIESRWMQRRQPDGSTWTGYLWACLGPSAGMQTSRCAE